MSEEQTSATRQTAGPFGGESGTSGDTSGTTQPATQPEFQPITSQEDLNKVISQRIDRERAKFSDYGDVKAKAEKFDQLEEANKSEVERAAAQTAAVETERDESRAETSRLRVALKHGLSESDAELLNDLRDEDAMSRLAERLAQQAAADDPTVGFGVDHSTTQTTHAPNKDDQARSLFGI